jgi:hypothetical protein
MGLQRDNYGTGKDLAAFSDRETFDLGAETTYFLAAVADLRRSNELSKQ